MTFIKSNSLCVCVCLCLCVCVLILYQLSHKGSPRILEWVAYPFSSGSSRPRNWTRVSAIAGRFFTNWAMRESDKWKWSHSGMSNSLQPHGLQPTSLLRPWDFPGKNTGVGCHFLLQRIFSTQGHNLHFLLGRQILYHWATWEAHMTHMGDQ